MPILAADRILNLLTLWSSFSVRRKALPKSWFYDISLVICLLLTTVILLAALMITGLLVFYDALVSHGWQQNAAMAATAAGTILLMIGLLWATHYKIRTLLQSHTYDSAFKSKLPMPEQLSGIADAFVSGLLRRPRHPD